METEKANYEHRVIRICLDGQRENGIYGSLHSAYCREAIPFGDIAKALVTMEDILRYRGFPEAMFKSRGFKGYGKRRKKEVCQVQRRAEEIAKQYGKQETLLVYVTKRNYAGIQGHFVCVSSGKILKYQSELEFLKLVESQVKLESSKMEASM